MNLADVESLSTVIFRICDDSYVLEHQTWVQYFSKESCTKEIYRGRMWNESLFSWKGKLRPC
jgi:hypothetical protein